MAQIISNYQIDSVIGEGGMGKVYLGSFIDAPQKKVAIKELNAEQATDPNIRLRFQREAEILAKLEHPGIVKFYDFKYQNGLFYLVMEYVHGKSLSEYILAKDVTIGFEQRIELFKKILEALHYAHERHIVHRDIKPSNVMVTPNNEVKVLDFGIARIKDNNSKQTTFGTILGTPMYMSPEQIKGFTADHRSDIYSLGVLLHFMLSKSPPYDEKSVSEYEIKTNVIRNALPRLVNIDASIPPNMQSIIDKATDKNMTKRFQTCAEFKKSLNPISNNFIMKTIIIGRDSNCDIVLNDSSISRRHAELSVINGQYIYRDVSSNGSFIGGKKTTGTKEVIYPGTEILLAGKIPLPWTTVQSLLPLSPIEVNLNSEKTTISPPQYQSSNINDGGSTYKPIRPQNFKVASILVLVFCGILWGAIAYSYASKVDNFYDNGQYNKAEEYSNKAKTWCIVGVCVLAFFLIISIA